MALNRSKILKIMFNDQLEYIECPINANYEECIAIALDRFEIPFKFKSSIQISNDSDEIFEKHTFEYYNLLFPSPATIFTLKINDDGEIRKQHSEVKRKPFAKLHNKRKHRDENIGVPVSRQNCFLGSSSLLVGDEQMNKKQKINSSKINEFGVLRKTISRRTIRL